MAILLVPLAIDDGTSRKRRVGKESIDPPPAIVFKKPARQPTEIRIVIDPRSTLPVYSNIAMSLSGHRMPTCVSPKLSAYR